ncbi:MAG: hypothetical protein AB1489_39785 [Acidobacteriota bacterium]
MVIRMQPTISFCTATAARLEGLEDPEVLAIAAQDERILVSHDQSTMPNHFAEFISSNLSYGLLIVPQKIPINVGCRRINFNLGNDGGRRVA